MSVLGADPSEKLSIHSIERPLLTGRFFYSCGTFVLLGVLTTMLGPLLPVLSHQWRLSPTMAGSLFSWQFAGATLGTLISAQLRKLPAGKISLIGLAFSSLGTLGVALLSWPAVTLSVALYGLGLGFSIPAINLEVSQANTLNRTSALALLNSSWTAGAIIGPIVMRVFHDIKTFLGVLAIALATSLVLGMFLTAAKTTPVNASASISQKSLSAAMIFFAALFFLYVGTENAISGWVSTYAVPVLQDERRSMTASALFWTAFLCARLLSASFLRAISKRQLLAASVAVSGLGIIALFLSQTNAILVAGICFAGLGLGSIYPLLIADMVDVIGVDNPAATICFAFSGLGAAILPFLSGWMGQATGRIKDGLAISASAICLILFLYFRVLSLESTERSAERLAPARPVS